MELIFDDRRSLAGLGNLARLGSFFRRGCRISCGESFRGKSLSVMRAVVDNWARIVGIGLVWAVAGLSCGVADDDPKGGGGMEIFRAAENDLEHLEFFEAHVVKAEENPKGTFVISGVIAKPGKAARDPDWRAFARENALHLVSLGFKPAGGIRDRGAIGNELADLLDEALSETIGDTGNRIGFARDWGAEWFLRAIHADPGDWKYWAVRGARRYPVGARGADGEEFPAGMILNADQSRYRDARHYFEELRRIDPDRQRVTFVGSDQRHIANLFLDRFYRQFVSAVYRGETQEGGRWFAIWGSEQPPPDGNTPWMHHSWTPNDELAGAWKLLNRERDNAPRPSRELLTFDSEAGEQTLHLRIPEVISRDASIQANGVILWLTQRDSEEELHEVLMHRLDPLVRYAEENRMPIVAWNVGNVWPHDFSQVADDAKSGEVERADRQFIPIGDAMVGAVRKLCRKRGWPADRYWFLSADAAASRYGLMMAQGYPFSAVHLHAPTGFENLLRNPEVPWLLTTGWKGRMNADIVEFAKTAHRDQWPVLFKRYPSLGHRHRWDQRELTAAFFSHVFQLERRGGESYGWSSDWDKPALPEKFRQALETRAEGDSDEGAETTLPEDFERSDYAPDRPEPGTPGEWFAESLRRAYLIGDWRRGMLADPRKFAADGNPIPPWWRVRLPDWELAEAWATTAAPYPDLNEDERQGLEKYRKPTNGSNGSNESGDPDGKPAAGETAEESSAEKRASAGEREGTVESED